MPAINSETRQKIRPKCGIYKSFRVCPEEGLTHQAGLEGGVCWTPGCGWWASLLPFLKLLWRQLSLVVKSKGLKPEGVVSFLLCHISCGISGFPASLNLDFIF